MKKYNQILYGLFIGDFISTMGHWVTDTYLNYSQIKNPFFKSVALDNEMHHFIPRTILSVSFFRNAKAAIQLNLIILVLLFTLFGKNFMKKNHLSIISFSFVVSLTNIIHRFSHLREHEVSGLMKFLQKIGLTISHKFHSKHHGINPEKEFGVLNQYTNLIYDNLKIWVILEKILFGLFKIKPNKRGTVDYYKSLWDKKLKKIMKSKNPRILTEKEYLYYREKLAIFLDKQEKKK